jgi:ribonucleotide reductase alpha subunit
MDIASKILSDVTVFSRYAKYNEVLGRRENWTELVDRNKQMHIAKFPQLREAIEEAYTFVYDKKVLPSMRSMQFGGRAIEVNNSRIYNCSFQHIDSVHSFSETMFLLLAGCGVGYSVQKKHIEKLPPITKPSKGEKKFLIGDSIEGWADAVKVLLKSYTKPNSPNIRFDYSSIRAKGTPIKTGGGKAPGPEPLRRALDNVRTILDSVENGEQLRSVQIHDMLCHLADAVLAGGIRRSAMISLFDIDDETMLSCKSNFTLVSHQPVTITKHDQYGNEIVLEVRTVDEATNTTYKRTKIVYNDPAYGVRTVETDVAEHDIPFFLDAGVVPWFYVQEQRGRANNSVVLVRHKMKKKSDFERILKITEESKAGEPGIFWTNNPDWGTNPSLRAGTKVVTTEGIFPIEQLEGKNIYVKNLEGKISPAKCFLSGKNKQLYKIRIKGGHEYFCTPEHKWPILKNGKYTKTLTTEISVGDKLPVIKQDKLFDGNFGTYEDGFVYGWQYGDGWITTRGDGFIQHGFVVSNKDCESGVDTIIENYLHSNGSNAHFATRNNGTKELNTINNKLNERAEMFGVSKKEFGLPKTIWTSSEEFRKGIIDGLFSADGHVEKDKKRITLTSKHEKLVKDVSELLGFYGIRSSIIKGKSTLNNKEFFRYNLRISDTCSIEHFRNLFKFTVKYKQETLDSYNCQNSHNVSSVEVESIELTNIKEDVWDITVFDDTHCFQIAHCVTGNCGEIGLRTNQFCNLCEINASDILDQDDFDARVKAAAFIGTLQASYTDFHYLRDVWRKTTEKEALLGIGMTGIASGKVLALDMAAAAEIATKENDRVAKLIGINKAARVTTVKPSGTTSCVLGCSSGIHAWHNDFYLRRMRLLKTEAIYGFLKMFHPELLEDDAFNKNNGILVLPQRAPEGAITRKETAIEQLERMKKVYLDWIHGGHRRGDNTHNVSITVSVRDGEWPEVTEWMWKNKDSYAAISLLPHSEHTYHQAPFQDINETEYNERVNQLISVDIDLVREDQDYTNLAGEVACSNGACIVT